MNADDCPHCGCFEAIPEIVAENPEWWGPEGYETCCDCEMQALIVVSEDVTKDVKP